MRHSAKPAPRPRTGARQFHIRSAISEWPERSTNFEVQLFNFSCKPRAARGGVMTSRLPSSSSTGQQGWLDAAANAERAIAGWCCRALGELVG